MTIDTRRVSQAIAAALIATVATQVIYMALGASGQSHIAYPIWRTEAIAALLVAVLGFALLKVDAIVAGCLVVSGILNLMQTAMGLTLFYQLGYGGEAPPEPAFFAVLGLSFFLYFAAKVAIGFAASVLGVALWRSTGADKVIGGLAMLTGWAAVGFNVTAMLVGMDMVFRAGAAGTAAAFFLAMALVRTTRKGAPVG